MSDRHSFFLVIEGLDGSGKSEISRRLAELMRATLDDRIMLTFEPHDPSAAGLYIRRVLRKKIRVSSRTLALAFALNRADHNERVIEPFLAQNTGPRLVLCDRYVLSSLVYNSDHDLTMDAVWDLNSGARRPDLTLFLDASAEICYARMGSRGGNRELFESNLADSRSRYFEAIEFIRQRGEQVVVVDANPDLLSVINRIIDVLKAVGPRWLSMQKLMFLEATAPAVLTPPPLELERWMRDFIDRYTAPALAEAALDDGVRRLVANEVNTLSLDELTALMMNFLQTDRRYRFESAWPGQPVDYTVIRPSGESGGLVILQDERRWEGVMRALESEFIAPHYSIRRDSIQFVVALDPSHAGEEVAQFVPDTGSVPVEVYGRGTLIQYFTRYITRRVSAEHSPAPSEAPQMTMPMPEGDTLGEDWSLAAALNPLPPAPPEPPARPSRTTTQEIWIAQQDYVPGPDEYLPVSGGYYQDYDLEASEPELVTADEPLVMDYDTGELAVIAEAALPPPPETDLSWMWTADAQPEAEEPATESGDYAFAPPPEAVMPAVVEQSPDAVADAWDAGGADANDLAPVSDYVFTPSPETELPLTPEDIDTGADVYELAMEMAQAETEPGASGKWETRDDLAAVGAEYAVEADVLPAEHGFDFEQPGDNGFSALFANPITPAEMDAIAALYSSLDDAPPASETAPNAEQEEERG